MGKACVAVAKALGRPVHGVIMQHFTRNGHATGIGAVAAKEEVWEVSAQVAGACSQVRAAVRAAWAQLLNLNACAGWLASVLVLNGLQQYQQQQDSAQQLVVLWSVFQTAHIACRYFSLK
jgi:hypothetical protein